MLSLLTGSPGSGKTLLAIDILLKVANNNSSELSSIEVVYTNIGGFKFDYFDYSKIDFKRFVIKDFYKHLQELYKIYVDNGSNDDVDSLLISYCKAHNLFNAYFVIDEAHNDFDNQDKIKQWWFTYHRHMSHEILLITQNKSLINAKYRNIPEIFIQAQPRSKSISKNTMRYFNYTDYRMSQKFSTTQITVSKNHFKIYTSGNNSNQKRVGLKYIYSFVAFVVVMILAFIFLFFKLTSDNQKPQLEKLEKIEKIKKIEKSERLENKVSYSVVKNTILDDLVYMNLTCSIEDRYCLYNGNRINLDFYLKMKHLFSFEEIAVEKLLGSFISIDVYVTDDFYKLYNKGNDNEKVNNNGSSSSLTGVFK